MDRTIWAIKVRGQYSCLLCGERATLRLPYVLALHEYRPGLVAEYLLLQRTAVRDGNENGGSENGSVNT